MSENKEQFVLEDGRKAEKTVTENKINDKESQKVIEIKEEVVLPLKTTKRIIEKTRSYVYEIVTETVDQETGRVIDSKVEEIDCVTGAVKTGTQAQPDQTVKKLNLSSIDVDSYSNKKSWSGLKDAALTAVIVVQVLALVYLLFLSK